MTRQDWQSAFKASSPIFDFIDIEWAEADELLAFTLGEGQFGPGHWSLSSSKRLYYLLKPMLPRPFTRVLRRHYSNPLGRKLKIDWPIDKRYALYQQESLRQILLISGKKSLQYLPLWPDGHHYAFVMTHDIETEAGQAFVRQVADLEESLGFRSSFNFVLERYPLDRKLIQDLKDRGFEVGCHELKHDGRLFSSKGEFRKRAAKINAYMKEFGMAGFRAPLTHRNPEWMQELEIEYDLSFFDTDPFEPIPGGVMTIWPFFIGHFLELPYTLVQDYTLTSILGERTPRIWLEKVGFIEQYQGMALVNSHPDYLREKHTWDVYHNFLTAMKARQGYWHALPREVTSWWKSRSANNINIKPGKVSLRNECLDFSPAG